MPPDNLYAAAPSPGQSRGAGASSHDPYLSNQVFGLTVSSAFEIGLPLTRLVGPADIFIDQGSVPSLLPHGVWKAACVQMNETEIVFSLPRLGRVMASQGNRIIVQAHAQSNTHALAPFLRTAGLGAILHQRGAVTLHAAVVSIGGGAVALAGASGAGKSVLAAALQAQGVALVSDEICCCDPTSLQVSSGVPEIWVWPDAAKCAAIDQVDAPRVRDDLSLKRLVAGAFAAGTWPLTRLYYLEPGDPHENGSVESLPPAEAVALFLDNLYQPQLYPLQMRRAVAECAMRCAKELPCRILRIPRSLSRLGEVVDCLARDAAL